MSMNWHPIIFPAPMVRAILEGRKTQTRRICKITHRTPGLAACLLTEGMPERPKAAAQLCPYGALGDRLWVRETFAFHDDRQPPIVYYRADDQREYPTDGKWRSPIHMPRWASRITLEVTDIWVERLQDISDADAVAEGVDPFPGLRRDDDAAAFNRIGPTDNDSFPIARYAALWEQIHGPGSWDANPWVWRIEFRRAGDKQEAQ